MSLPRTINVSRVRGDSYPWSYRITYHGAPPPEPCTGATFTLTIDLAVDLVLVGTVTDAVNWRVQFHPTASQMNITEGAYPYVLRMTDDVGDVRTLVRGTFTIV